LALGTVYHPLGFAWVPAVGCCCLALYYTSLPYTLPYSILVLRRGFPMRGEKRREADLLVNARATA
jgi:hypothetical protein